VRRVHLIIDFQYLYHRHIYSINAGRKRRLSCMVDGVEVDTTRIYYPLKDFESFRRYWESLGKEVTISVCFDSKSDRKEADEDYKSNRGGRFDSVDFEAINTIRELMSEAGYNIYKEDGKEADDLIADLIKRYENDFDFTVIYTPDSDMMCYLSEKVGIMRYKTGGNGKKGDFSSSHTPVSINNFAEYMSAELKCDIRLNTIILYKALCGDKSDCIKGVKGFGPKAFDKFMSHLDEKGTDYEVLVQPSKVKKLILDEVDYLGESAVEQALNALELIECSPVTVTESRPIKNDSLEKREKAYMKYIMKSLVN